MVLENQKVSILGTEYTMKFFDENLKKCLSDEDTAGICDCRSKVIYVDDLFKNDKWKDENSMSKIIETKTILRHEIIHAFLYESGLGFNSNSSDC